MRDFTAKGRCLCGAVRFEATAKPLRASYCHCSKCRQHTGAPVMLGVVFPSDAVAVSGKVAVYASSETGRRHFCPTCGSSLFFTFTDAPDRMEIMAGVFEDPSFIEPSFHLYAGQAIACCAVDDDLPKYEVGLS
jgi:hypothetical protein